MRKIIPSAFILFALAAPALVSASTGAMTVSAPSSAAVGQRFSVMVRAKSGGAAVNAVGADLSYPSDLIKAVSVSGPSAITLMVAKDVSAAGAVSIQGGIVPSLALDGDAIGTVVFEALAPGSARISVADSSAMYLDDGKGTDILASRGDAIVKVAKAAPVLNANANVVPVPPPANAPAQPVSPPANVPPPTGQQPAPVQALSAGPMPCVFPLSSFLIVGISSGLAGVLIGLALVELVRRRR